MRSVAIDAVIIDAAAAVDAGAREPSPGGGLQVVRRLRESPGRAELPVLALGGFARDASVPPRLGAGFSAYLAKPVDVGTLHAALEECLARAAARGPSR
jgi:CheY-like chemotaxis protein